MSSVGMEPLLLRVKKKKKKTIWCIELKKERERESVLYCKLSSKSELSMFVG